MLWLCKLSQAHAMPMLPAAPTPKSYGYQQPARPTRATPAHCHGGSVCQTAATQRAFRVKHVCMRRYGLRFSGHSLGAGAAALATHLLHTQPHRFSSLLSTFPRHQVDCFCAAAPPVLSLDLARASADYITTLTLGHDVVARASIANLEQLRQEVLESRWWEELINPVVTSPVFQNVQAVLERVDVRELVQLIRNSARAYDEPGAGAAPPPRSMFVSALDRLHDENTAPTVRARRRCTHVCFSSRRTARTTSHGNSLAFALAEMRLAQNGGWPRLAACTRGCARGLWQADRPLRLHRPPPPPQPQRGRVCACARGVAVAPQDRKLVHRVTLTRPNPSRQYGRAWLEGACGPRRRWTSRRPCRHGRVVVHACMHAAVS